MRHSLIYVFTFLILGSLFSCKRKYEEGPLISLSSKCKRIENGWILKYYYIDGNDSTQALYNALGITNNKFKMILVKPREGNCRDYAEIVVRIAITPSTTETTDISGGYGFSEDGKYLYLNFYTDLILNFHPTTIGPLFTNEKLSYRIKRLTKDELWLDITYKGKYCWLHFSG